MAIERWQPSRMLRDGPRRGLSRLEQEMEDMFGRFFRGWPWPEEAGHWVPALDVIDRKEEVVVRADLPGPEQKDVKVSVEQGRLTIRGERKEEKEEKDESCYVSERWAGAFVRSVPVPPGVDTEKVKASFKNGVLEVHLPKTKEAKPTKIEIKVE